MLGATKARSEVYSFVRRSDEARSNAADGRSPAPGPQGGHDLQYSRVTLPQGGFFFSPNSAQIRSSVLTALGQFTTAQLPQLPGSGQ